MCGHKERKKVIILDEKVGSKQRTHQKPELGTVPSENLAEDELNPRNPLSWSREGHAGSTGSLPEELKGGIIMDRVCCGA